MIRLSDTTQRDTITLSNLHAEDCDFIYEVCITKFDRCSLRNDADIKHHLGDLAWKMLRDAGLVYQKSKLIGRLRISRGPKEAVKTNFIFFYKQILNLKILYFLLDLFLYINQPPLEWPPRPSS